MLTGSSLIEVGELLPHNALTAKVGQSNIAFTKRGLYRIDATAADLRVYQGSAEVTSGSIKAIAKKGHEIALTGETVADTKFNLKQSDPFYDWSAGRANTIASANLISARVANNSNAYSGSSWAWNPAFGLFTFLPARGYYDSPFGPTFYSPAALVYYFPAHGYSNGGGSASAATTSAPRAASSAPPPMSRGPMGAVGPRGGGMRH